MDEPTARDPLTGADRSPNVGRPSTSPESAGITDWQPTDALHPGRRPGATRTEFWDWMKVLMNQQRN
ncbi:MAG: hypothetical protein ABIQ06_09085 [Caldimonas sp.]